VCATLVGSWNSSTELSLGKLAQPDEFKDPLPPV
jgi:hypothetical protein